MESIATSVETQSVTRAVEQALQQAIAHQHANQLQDAERLYRAILDAQPSHPDANHNLGLLVLQRNQPSGALPYLKTALEADPDQGQYWISYIGALMQAGQGDAARKVLRQGQQRGLRGEGVQALEARLPENSPRPKDIETLVGLLAERRYAEAEPLALAMTKAFPLNGTGWKGLGVTLKQRGQISDALDSLQKAATLSLGDADAHNRLGVTLHDLGRLDEAEASFQRALQVKPDFAEAHNGLAVALRDLGRLDEAEASFRRALDIKPDFELAHSNLGAVLYNQGRNEEALFHFRSALDTSPLLVAAQQGAATVLGRLVPGWHVPMINERKRNDAYFSALESMVTPQSEVFEIGTGSGLLSMMAAKLGAKRVTTCEATSIIAEVAKHIVAENGYENIVKVIPKRSVNVALGEDLPEKADILVSEIFSSELLGESVLYSLEDAKCRLLKPNGKVLPAAASIMIALFSGNNLKENLVVDDCVGFNLRHFNSLVSRKRLVVLHDLGAVLLTDELEAFRFDFQNNSFFPSQTLNFRIPVRTSGRCYGVIQWIRLEMNGEIVFDNHPSDTSSLSNWQRVAYLFDEPLDVKLGQSVLITAAHDRNVPWFFLSGVEPT